MPRISLDEIQSVTIKALLNHGAREWIATSVSKAVRRAEETGNVICGLYYLQSYCDQLVSGRVRGDVEPVVEKTREGAVKSDALFGFSQPAFDMGYLVAIEAAKKNGISSFAVANAHTCTSLGYFTEKIAHEGLIVLGFTNASSVVAPPGGNSPVIGTNPIAMTVPGEAKPSMHFDFSTSAVALGKITMAKAAGNMIPEGWAVDSDGRPTTDPVKALGGTLVSAGGYKGWGFGLMSEIFAAGLTGSVNSLDIKGLKSPDGPPHGIGQYYIIIDTKTFTNEFDEKFQKVSDAVSMQPGTRIPGSTRVELSSVDVSDDLWRSVENLT